MSEKKSTSATYPRPQETGATPQPCRNRQPVIVWQTTHFPYGCGEQFIESEIASWQDVDATVVLLPYSTSTPSGVELRDTGTVVVSTALDELRRSRSSQVKCLVKALLGRVLWRELRSLGRQKKLKLATLKRAVIATAQTHLMGGALRHLAKKYGGIDLVYTYWIKPLTFGACLAKADGLVNTVVTRAHNNDLYEESRDNAYNPLVRQFGNDVDRYFLISDLGKEYLCDRYGVDRNRVEIARLGVKVPQPSPSPDSGDEDTGRVRLTPPTPPGQLHLVSASGIRRNKRVDLIVDAVRLVAQAMPGTKVSWTHFGDGPLRDEVEAHAAAVLPGVGVDYRFAGFVPNAEVLDYYDTHPVDLFVNASEDEGVPVSIMEAMVRGIPAVAPRVGAVEEIVTPESGYLMPAGPTPSLIAQTIVALSDAAKAEPLRRDKAKFVADKYNAPLNYRRFVSGLLTVAAHHRV